ncbi:MAG: TatD family hydrolase [Pseudomonadales bacterium]
MLIDSHCHLNMLDHPEAALERARQAGISGFLCIGVERARIDQVLHIARSHADVWASVGQHPDVVDENLDWIEPLAQEQSVIAIGETGLDFLHADEADARRGQCERFERQLELAARLDLPIVVHTRQAEQETAALLTRHAGVTGVLHCFTESWSLAKTALDLGYVISISGIVTFRNAENVREVARRVPADRLLVETDCPWLAPVPYRGKTNEPAYVSATASALAELRGESIERLMETTTANFYRAFPRANSSS